MVLRERVKLSDARRRSEITNTNTNANTIRLVKINTTANTISPMVIHHET